MSSKEWFRQESWSDENRCAFRTRLNRARKSNRPQYLRIQALHLADVRLHDAALELLDEVLSTYEDKTQLSQTYLQLAESLAAIGREEQAIDAFRTGLSAERDFPNVQTSLWLQFPWYIVENEKIDCYSEARGVLNEFSENRNLLFPLQEYQFNGINAILNWHEGNTASAKIYAENALNAAKKEHSGIRYHDKLGLVNETGSNVHNRIKRIANVV